MPPTQTSAQDAESRGDRGDPEAARRLQHAYIQPIPGGRSTAN